MSHWTGFAHRIAAHPAVYDRIRLALIVALPPLQVLVNHQWIFSYGSNIDARVNAKVSVVHIGTHGREVEKALTKVFRRNWWHSAFSYPSHSEVNTVVGRVTFVDGAQTWVNPARPDLAAAFSAGS